MATIKELFQKCDDYDRKMITVKGKIVSFQHSKYRTSAYISDETCKDGLEIIINNNDIIIPPNETIFKDGNLDFDKFLVVSPKTGYLKMVEKFKPGLNIEVTGKFIVSDENNELIACICILHDDKNQQNIYTLQ